MFGIVLYVIVWFGIIWYCSATIFNNEGSIMWHNAGVIIWQKAGATIWQDTGSIMI